MESDTKVIKTYDEAGQGRKKCESCQKYVGARNSVCACGHEFVKKEGVSSANAAYDLGETVEYHPFATRILTSGQRYVTVLTPSDKCPATPKGLNKQAIDDWAEAVIEAGARERKIFAISALKYFLRYFYPTFSPEYKQACEFLTQHSDFEEVV